MAKVGYFFYSPSKTETACAVNKAASLHKPNSRLPLLSARPRLPSQLHSVTALSWYQVILLCKRRNTWVNDLPTSTGSLWVCETAENRNGDLQIASTTLFIAPPPRHTALTAIQQSGCREHIDLIINVFCYLRQRGYVFVVCLLNFGGDPDHHLDTGIAAVPLYSA